MRESLSGKREFYTDPVSYGHESRWLGNRSRAAPLQRGPPKLGTAVVARR